ncbi:MAG: hypothetical protein AB201_00905 [Parcubacteria bacterium C7867-006]|nr:MAG: hypothetical protein AB201_00905 [Parcubacteria bacterium C7867-006]
MKENFDANNSETVYSKESVEKKERAPEFNFESGVEESINRIVSILEKQPKVVVAFSGSSSNVGKTTLSKHISQGLYDRGIQSRSYMGVEEVHDRGPEPGDSVFIFQQIHLGVVNSSIVDKIKDIYNEDVRDAFKEKGLDISGIDFWVGIYRPDKPFASDVIADSNSEPIADIIIRNDMAEDK